MKKMKNFLDPPDDASLHFTLVFVNIFTFFCLVFFFVSTGVSIFEFGFFSFFFTFLYFVSFAPEFRRHVLFCLFVCLFFSLERTVDVFGPKVSIFTTPEVVFYRVFILSFLWASVIISILDFGFAGVGRRWLNCFHGISSSPATVTEFLLGFFLQFCRVGNGSDPVFPGSTRTLSSFGRFYWVLLGFTGFYWVLLGFTRF